MIILKTILFIWVMSSILLSLFLLFCYFYVGIEGIRKSDLLWWQLTAPYWVAYIVIKVTKLSFKEVKKKWK